MGMFIVSELDIGYRGVFTDLVLGNKLMLSQQLAILDDFHTNICSQMVYGVLHCTV